MNKTALMFVGISRKWGVALFLLALGMSSFAATFPLPMPTRPTNFPLSAPIDQGLRVFAWGYNDSGQTNIPAGVTNIVAIAAGEAHSLGLKANGTVVSWGQNLYGQSSAPEVATNLVAIDSGSHHNVALKANGRVVGWGYNGYGQTNPPVKATNVVAIAAGYFHSLALRSDGTVVGWGYNGYGQTNPPAGATNVVALAAGGDFGLVLKADSTVVGWGNNGSGQISIPASATNVVAVSAGGHHSLALRADGTVVAWGDNSRGQIDIPECATNVVTISAGVYHNLALRVDGAVVGWGEEELGAITIPTNATSLVAIAAGGRHSLALGRIPVSILTNPIRQRALESNSVTLNVTATGAPLYYQWRKDGTNISGATGPSLTLSPVRLGDAGVYSVVVSNVLGTVVSADAPLVVLPFGASVVRADGEEVIESVTREPSTDLTMETQFPNGYIFYTLDGTTPSFSSPLYTGPITVSNTIVVRALALSSDFSAMTEAPAVTVFVRSYSVAVSSGGAGSVAVSPAQPYYAAGSVVTMTASPDNGWSFLRWEGDATGNTNPLALTVNRSLQAWAVFGTTILTNVVGNGRIEMMPAGPADYGSSIELRAVPGPGQRFVAWGNALLGTNNPSLFTVTQPNPTVAALFTAGPAGLPVITLQSSNVALSAGSSLALSATATGSGPLNYQWRLNGTPITGATSATLNLNNASETAAGAYDLVVSGPAGTSASEKIQVMVTLFDVRPVLSLWGAPGTGFLVDRADDLEGGSWLVLTNGVLSGERRDVIDFSSTNRAQRFYRVRPAGGP